MYALFYRILLRRFAPKKGWVMVKEDGTIWPSTFAETNAMCWALAKETWALDGETQKEYSEWSPKQAYMAIVLI